MDLDAVEGVPGIGQGDPAAVRQLIGCLQLDDVVVPIPGAALVLGLTVTVMTLLPLR